MAEREPLYYTIVPKTVFTAHETQFVPGRTYHVTKAIYEGTLEGSKKKFADLCVKAEPRYTAP